MAKKLGTATGSKLAGAVPAPASDPSNAPQPANAPKGRKTEHLGLVSKKPATRKPRSYRLRPSDLERLSKIVEAVNELSTGRRVTETDVLRGLIVIGEKTTPKQLIDAIKDAFM